MPLILKVTSYQRLSPAQEPTKVLEGGRLSIGRGSESDWVLPDPERQISKCHCVIEQRDGRYLLTDTSTNGVFVNNSDRQLGRDNSVELHDGDRLRLSDYEISVSLSAAPAQGAAGPAARGLDDTAGAAPIPEDPFDLDGPASGALLGAGPDDQDLPDVPAPRYDLGPAQSELDEREAAAPVDQPRLLGVLEGPAEERPPDPGAAPDHLPADRQFFQTPTPLGGPPADRGDTGPAGLLKPDSGGVGGMIPDDWDLDRPSAPGPAPPPPVAPIPVAPIPAAPIPARPIPAAPAPGPIPDDWDLDSEPSPADVPVPQARAETPAPPSPMPEPTVAPPPPPLPPQQRAAQVPASQEQALQAFLQGAGLGHLQLSPAASAALMQTLGQIYRVIVQGMMEVLAARASVKNEFRVEQTTIQPFQNNPLKFSLSVDDAMESLLTKTGRGYMPPIEAVREGFDDIKAHQIATLAGMQSALTAVIARFDPEKLEKRLESSSLLDSLLPGKRKARYWDAFEQLYRQIASEAEDDFQKLFGEAFAKAYQRETGKRDGYE